jgi:hypothetical protein
MKEDKQELIKKIQKFVKSKGSKGGTAYIHYHPEYTKNGQIHKMPEIYTLILDTEKFTHIDAVWEPSQKLLRKFAQNENGRKYENMTQADLEYIQLQIQENA